MAIETQTLNQYVGTDSVGTQKTVVAPDMTTACTVYNEQNKEDPIVMQCTKQGILCVQPTTYTTFKAVAFDTTGVAETTCKVTPATYTVKAGTQLLFTAEAGEGWTFSKWTIDGVDAGTDAVAMLTIPASETTVIIQGVFVAST